MSNREVKLIILLYCHKFPTTAHWKESNVLQYEKSSSIPSVLAGLSSLTHVNCRHVFILGTKIFVEHCMESGFGGLVVSMLASGTQDRGFDPGRSRRIFRAKKSTA